MWMNTLDNMIGPCHIQQFYILLFSLNDEHLIISVFHVIKYYFIASSFSDCMVFLFHRCTMVYFFIIFQRMLQWASTIISIK